MALPPFLNANPAPDAGVGVVVVVPVEAPKPNVLSGGAAGVGAMALLPAPKANPELGAGAGVEDVAPAPNPKVEAGGGGESDGVGSDRAVAAPPKEKAGVGFDAGAIADGAAGAAEDPKLNVALEAGAAAGAVDPNANVGTVLSVGLGAGILPNARAGLLSFEVDFPSFGFVPNENAGVVVPSFLSVAAGVVLAVLPNEKAAPADGAGAGALLLLPPKPRPPLEELPAPKLNPAFLLPSSFASSSPRPRFDFEPVLALVSTTFSSSGASAGFVPKLKPGVPVDSFFPVAADDDALDPNVNPPDRGAALFSVAAGAVEPKENAADGAASFFSVAAAGVVDPKVNPEVEGGLLSSLDAVPEAPKEKLALADGAGAGALVLPPPKLNPPLPILADDEAGAEVALALALEPPAALSSPGFGVSHETHFDASCLFLT